MANKQGKRCTNYLYPMVYWLLMLLCNANISFFLIRNNLDFFNKDPSTTQHDKGFDQCNKHETLCLVRAYATWVVFEFFWILGIICHFRVMCQDPGFTEKNY